MGWVITIGVFAIVEFLDATGRRRGAALIVAVLVAFVASTAAVKLGQGLMHTADWVLAFVACAGGIRYVARRL